MIRSTTALLLSVLVTSTGGAESGADDRPSFGGLVEVSEVLLDVLVTDARGEVVVGLEAGDFVVEENDRPIELSGVSFYATRYSVDEPSAVPSSRYFILFFDHAEGFYRYGKSFFYQAREAVHEAKRWMDNDLEGGDWIAVAAWDGRLRVLADFGQDRDRIDDALDRAAAARIRPSPVQRPGPVGLPSLVRHLPERRELERRSRTIYDALELLSEAAAYTIGRKNLLLYTYGWSEEDLLSGRRDRRYREELAPALNDRNIAVYPMDITPYGRSKRQMHFLMQLAEDTGGQHFAFAPSYFAPLRWLGRENHGYYLLSYRSEHPAGEVGYAHVDVRTTDPSHRVRSRTGYRYGM